MTIANARPVEISAPFEMGRSRRPSNWCWSYPGTLLESIRTWSGSISRPLACPLREKRLRRDTIGKFMHGSYHSGGSGGTCEGTELMSCGKIGYTITMTFTQFIAAVVVGLVPSIMWLIFWLHEDASHSEPRWMLVLCFCAGMIAQR